MNDSPLAQELRFGSASSVHSLLAGGADPNSCGRFHISSTEFEAKLDALISFGWDINDCQLLHDAKHGLGKRVEQYLKRGADPNVTDQLGQTALHKLATIGIGRSAIRALFDAGSDIHARDKEGCTPLDLAKRAKRKVASNVFEELVGREKNSGNGEA